MRQSNQKSRSRGRGRKPQNPMSRNFESNGPDVKIRGNASHIAEKYASLARDALSNGDTVIAENYLQHAEHYNRIVAAAQQQSEARAAEMAEKRRAEQDSDSPEGEDASEAAEATSEDIEAKSPQKSRRKANGKSETGEDAGDQDDAQKERKTTRTRRPRKQPVAEAANGEAVNGNGSEKSDADGNDMPSVNPEAISEDAAALPEGLLGGVAAEES